jgi:hypothetical protein
MEYDNYAAKMKTVLERALKVYDCSKDSDRLEILAGLTIIKGTISEGAYVSRNPFDTLQKKCEWLREKTKSETVREICSRIEKAIPEPVTIESVVIA